MARSFGAELLGADGFAVRGPVSAAPAIGCALVDVGSNQLGWTSRPVVVAPAAGPSANSDYLSPVGWTPLPTVDLSSRVAKAGDSMTGTLTINPGGTTIPQLVLRPNVTQTANVIDVIDSLGLSRMSIDAAGTGSFPFIRLGSNQDSIAASSQLGYMDIRTNTSMRIRANPNITFKDYWSTVNMLDLTQTSATFANGITLDGSARIFGSGTVNYQGNGTTLQHSFTNQIGTTLTGSVVEISTGSAGAASGAKLLSLKDVTTEVASISKTGAATFSGNVTANNLQATNAFFFVNSDLLMWSTTANNDVANAYTFADSGGNSLRQVKARSIALGNLSNSIDGRIVTGTGQLDVRADNGLRIRNFANNADANLQAWWTTFQRVQANEQINISSGNGGIGIYANSMQIGSTSRIQFSATQPAAFNPDAEIQRNGVGQLDVRGDSGLRVRNFANSAFAGFSCQDATINAVCTAQLYKSNGLGNAANPAYCMAAATDSGLWFVSSTVGSRAVAISTDGAEAVRFGGSGTGRSAVFAGGVTTVGAMQVGAQSLGMVQIQPGGGANKGYISWHQPSTGTRVGYMGYQNTNDVDLVLEQGGVFRVYTTIEQGNGSARWTIPSAGQRTSQVGNGAGTWQSGYREAYNVAGVQCGFFGATPVAQQSIAAAATDAATTQTLANSLRTAFINLGLGV